MSYTLRKRVLKGSKVVLSGEPSKVQQRTEKGSLNNQKGLQKVIQNLFWFNKEPCLVLQIYRTLTKWQVSPERTK